MQRKNVFTMMFNGITLAVFCCLMPIEGAAAPDVLPPFDITATLGTSRVCLGEPILLHYKITNTSDERAWTNMGVEQKEWFSLKLEDEMGRSESLAHNFAPAQGEAVVSSPAIAPHGSLEGTVIVNRWVSPSHVGHYNLAISVQLPIGHGIFGNQSEGPLHKAFLLPLTVTAADPIRLHQIAVSLQRSLTAEDSQSQRSSDLQAIFSLPEEDKLPLLKTLIATAKPSDEKDILEGLRGAASPAAADVVAEMVWAPQHEKDPDSGSLPMLTLDKMYRQGDTAMKLHIEQIFSDHGSKVPTAPLMRLD